MPALKDLDSITSSLDALGFRLVRAEAGGMDSGVADFSNGTATIRILKDRSQWMLDGSRAILEPAGLWRAFDSTSEFRDTVVRYLQTK